MRTSRLFFQKALEVNPGYKEAYDKLKYLDNKIKSNGKR